MLTGTWARSEHALDQGLLSSPWLPPAALRFSASRAGRPHRPQRRGHRGWNDRDQGRAKGPAGGQLREGRRNVTANRARLLLCCLYTGSWTPGIQQGRALGARG